MRILDIVFLIFLFLTSPHPLLGQEKGGPSPISWQTPAQGLSFLRWEVRSPNGPVNSLAVFRIDPEYWSFRVFFNREPRTLKEWHQATGAAIICNGGFYLENNQPAGRILVDGVFLGPPKNRYMKGMFLAEPRKGFEDLPRALLLDLKNEKKDEIISAYTQGIQSFPLLLDPQGKVRVNPSSFQAHRTALAQDHLGRLYILITEQPSFTLYDLGNYLKALPFGFQYVLNLDGGFRTQLSVQLKGFKYLFTARGEGRETLFFPEPVKLPSVIGIFPRGRK
jgi:hypothetical protein